MNIWFNELKLFALRLGDWNTRFAGTSVAVIVELIQTHHVRPLAAALLIEVAAIVLKGIEILSDTLNQLLKSWVRLGTGSGE